MPGYRHASIISFTYNVGGGALCKSSVARYINAGEPDKGCDALLLYVKANKHIIQGLKNRRMAERKLCLNNNEPPLPHEDVMAEPFQNVDQKTADKEAAAALTAPMKGVTVTPAPKPKGIVDWLMER
jgi:hypothetical protein